MARPEQEKDEKEIIEYFIKSRNIECLASPPKKDPPDYVLKTDNKRIGVEIYEYHEPSEVDGLPTRRAGEDRWWRLTEAIDDLTRRHKDFETVRACLDFKSFDLPPPHKHDEFVESAIDFVKRKLPLPSDDFHDFPVSQQEHPLLTKYLNSIAIEECNDYSWREWAWTFDDAQVSYSETKTIRALNKKLAKPRPGGYDEYWLIVEQGLEIARGIFVFSVEQLENSHQLNAALMASAYDEVHIIRGHTGEYSWKKGGGWTALPRSESPGRDVFVPYRRKRFP